MFSVPASLTPRPRTPSGDAPIVKITTSGKTDQALKDLAAGNDDPVAAMMSKMMRRFDPSQGPRRTSWHPELYPLCAELNEIGLVAIELSNRTGDSPVVAFSRAGFAYCLVPWGESQIKGYYVGEWDPAWNGVKFSNYDPSRKILSIRALTGGTRNFAITGAGDLVSTDQEAVDNGSSELPDQAAVVRLFEQLAGADPEQLGIIRPRVDEQSIVFSPDTKWVGFSFEVERKEKHSFRDIRCVGYLYHSDTKTVTAMNEVQRFEFSNRSGFAASRPWSISGSTLNESYLRCRVVALGSDGATAEIDLHPTLADHKHPWELEVREFLGGLPPVLIATQTHLGAPRLRRRSIHELPLEPQFRSRISDRRGDSADADDDWV